MGPGIEANTAPNLPAQSETFSGKKNKTVADSCQYYVNYNLS